MTIEKKSPLPRYYQLMNILEEEIERLDVGDRMTSERELNWTPARGSMAIPTSAKTSSISMTLKPSRRLKGLFGLGGLQGLDCFLEARGQRRG